MGLREALERETVADAGYRDPITIEVGASVADAVAVMQEHDVGALLVTRAGKLHGIFTERDLLVRVLGRGASLDTRIDEVLTPEPTVARADEPIYAPLARMHAGGLRHVPIVDDRGAPIGMISIKRAVHFLAEHLPEVVYNLPPEPGAYPDRPEGG
jgi:CBS domain-containing protein